MILLLLSLAMAAAPWTGMKDVLPHEASSELPVLQTHLIPIGFSPAGAFAWIELPPDEAIGCFLWSFVIVDLVTDKELHREHWDEGTGGSCEKIVDTASLLALKGPAFQAALAKHGVIADQALALQPLPYAHEGDLFDVRQVPGPPQFDQGAISVPLDLSARSQLHGRKSIGTVYVQATEDMPRTWGQELLGVIPSPFEPRVVVVLREIGRGWEGPPNPEHLRLFGASLEKGFPAPSN